MVIDGKESTNNFSHVPPHAHRAKPDSFQRSYTIPVLDSPKSSEVLSYFNSSSF